jgi:dihydroxy-acid dehydratase
MSLVNLCHSSFGSTLDPSIGVTKEFTVPGIPDGSEQIGRLRSQAWFDALDEPTETAVYIERMGNFGVTREELQSGRPVIGIAQTGSDIAPCNRIHLTLVARVKDGIRDAGGIPLEFPVHPIQETLRRPTAALDRNLAYLGLVEILAGYPFDGVVLTGGCDKTTPVGLMAVATVDLPSISLSGGPMLDSWHGGKLAGSGVAMWVARRDLAAGEIDTAELVNRVAKSAPSAGHCNTMGTALTMNSLAEALGMTLPGSGSIPAPYAERAATAYETGRRIVAMVAEDLTPSKVLTREAFENAIVVNSAIGGSTNAPIHLNALAQHAGVSLEMEDWDRLGRRVGLLANVQPAGEHLGEGFHRAGGVAAIIGELLSADLIHGEALTVSGSTVSAVYGSHRTADPQIIRPVGDPIQEQAGFTVLSGNLFDSAVLKTSVISEEFREKYLREPGNEGRFTVRAIVFEGPEDYRARINDPDLNVDDRCILVVRNAGPIGYPGSAEVVNMTPPDDLVRQGVRMLPCLGDGRQSGTSDSPSILNVSPEAAAGGNLALLETGDLIAVDLPARRLNVELNDEVLTERRSRYAFTQPPSHTPWEELYRAHVTQLGDGAVLDIAPKYREVRKIIPRHSH